MQAIEERAETRSAIGSPTWKALESHYKKVRKLHLRKLFADDPTRGERLTASAVGIELDYSKNRITDQTLQLLLQLAKDAGLQERIDAMFSGAKINITENRAVLHVALRAPAGASIVVDGQNNGLTSGKSGIVVRWIENFEQRRARCALGRKIENALDERGKFRSRVAGHIFR